MAHDVGQFLTEQNRTEQNRTEQNRIAYIMLCHQEPKIVARICKALKYQEDKVFIHVDNKTAIDDFIREADGLSNVCFVKNRINNYWGGFNSIVATMETVRMAMCDGDYSRFILLQGADYPLFSPAYIHKFFDANKSVEFCKATDVSDNPCKGAYMKVCGFWMFDHPRTLFFRGISWILGKINMLGIKYRKAYYEAGDTKWNVYHSWAQFALTHDCMQFVLNYYDANPEYNDFMRNRFPPDELYIPTILYNSGFRDNVDSSVIINRYGLRTKLNCTYFEYPDKVTVFTDRSDLEWLRKTGCLFVRKVNSASLDLLDEIDKQNEKDYTE